MVMRTASDRIARPYVLPPGTPAHIMKILREAFVKVAADPELIENSKKYNLKVDYIPREECLKIINYVFSQPDNIVREFSKYVQF